MILRLAVPLLAVALLTAGCSDQELDVEGLAPGPCSTLGPVLQDVDGALREVEDDDLEPGEAGRRFAQAQAALQEQEGEASDDVAPALVELRRQLGLYRISVDSNEYDGSQAEPVAAAVEDVLTACR